MYGTLSTLLLFRNAIIIVVVGISGQSWRICKEVISDIGLNCVLLDLIVSHVELIRLTLDVCTVESLNSIYVHMRGFRASNGHRSGP